MERKDNIRRVAKEMVLDTFIAAVRYMGGEPKKPWWTYTPERKRELAARKSTE